MIKGVYTTEEASQYLGVTVGRVRQMIIDGLLKTERFGRAHVITKEALKFAANRRTKPGPISTAERKSKKGIKK